MNKVIGITGRAGVGKSYAIEILKKEIDFYGVDLDEIGHLCLMELDVQTTLADVFGSLILENKSGRQEINRQILGDIVFSDQESLDLLNKIVHPRLRQNAIKDIQHYRQRKLVIVVGSLLYELDLMDVCDDVIVIDSDSDDLSLLDEGAQQKIKRIRKSQRSSQFYRNLSENIILNQFDLKFSEDIIGLVLSFMKKK